MILNILTILSRVLAVIVLIFFGLSIYIASTLRLDCRGCRYCSWDHQHVPEPKGHVYGHRPKPPLPNSQPTN